MGCLLLRRKWFVIAAVVAALFVSPVVVTRDPEIVVLNAIGLGFAALPDQTADLRIDRGPSNGGATEGAERTNREVESEEFEMTTATATEFI